MLMNNLIETINSDFEKEMTKLVNDLYLAYDPETEKRLKEEIKEMYSLRIPTALEILDGIENSNYEIFHGLTYTLLKYKEGNIFCTDEEGYEKKSGAIGFHVCEECDMKDDCYDNVFINDVQWEFGDQTFPLHLCSSLHSVLTDGDLCVYMDKYSFFEYEDLVAYYDYGNVDVLYEFYRDGNNKLGIINHAQLTMFDDLFDRNEDGSCYNYGNFLFILDPFERKKREDYFLEGGK